MLMKRLTTRHGTTFYQGREKRLPWYFWPLVALVTYIGIYASTQFNLQTQVQGVLPTANGGTGQNSTATFPASGTVMTTGTNAACSQLPALTGDATTTAGNCATTVVKINGTTIGTSSAADQMINTTASGTGQWATLPNVTAGNALTYSTSTHTFGTAAVISGTLVDAETPTGSCPTTTLTLAHTPSPSSSLKVYKNGQRLIVGAGADYTLATATITLAVSCSSSPADQFIADYRY